MYKDESSATAPSLKKPRQFRVEAVITQPLPHRREQLTHPVLKSTKIV
jgi:hypothetical protein